MEKKETKASKIRAYFSANPDARPEQAAADLGVNLQYAYAIKKQMKGDGIKRRKRQPNATPTEGQLVLRSVLTKKDEEIQSLRSELFNAAAIIRYLESRMERQRGAAI